MRLCALTDLPAKRILWPRFHLPLSSSLLTYNRRFRASYACFVCLCVSVRVCVCVCVSVGRTDDSVARSLLAYTKANSDNSTRSSPPPIRSEVTSKS